MSDMSINPHDIDVQTLQLQKAISIVALMASVDTTENCAIGTEIMAGAADAVLDILVSVKTKLQQLTIGGNQ